MAEKKKSKLTVLPLSAVFTLVSMGLFIVKILNSFYGKAVAEDASPVIKYAVLPLLILFAICFAALAVINIRDAKALKQSAVDTKYAMNTTKSASSVLEAAVQLINVIIAVVIAYDSYRGVDIKWYHFEYYFTMIILIYTLFTTVLFIIRKSLKMKKKAEKRHAARQKAAEKEERIAERQRMIAEATAEKQKREAERIENEKAAMPKKDQSHKAVKKIPKK